MQWYLTKLVYRIICGDGNHIPQFDEQLRLINADEENEAFNKAVLIGKQEQEVFYNQQEKLVQWQFINVAELYKINGLMDGAELYSSIQETENPDLFIELTNRKAEHISTSITKLSHTH